MKRLKYSIFLILSVFMTLTSCKKSKQLKPDEVPVPPPTETHQYIPVKFESADFTLNLKYKENTALLEEITDTDDNKTIITYTTAQHLYKIEKYENGDLFYVVYYELGDKKVISKALMFDYKDLVHSYIPRGFYTITYNEQRKANVFNYYNNNNSLIRTEALLYNGSFNLSEIKTIEHPGTTIITNYTFDQQKGIGSNITNSELLASELEYWFFLCTNNNFLTTVNQESPKENISFKYEYNEHGYPSNAQFTSNNNTQNIKITYKRLSP